MYLINDKYSFYNANMVIVFNLPLQLASKYL